MATSENKEYLLQHESQGEKTLSDNQLWKALHLCQSDTQISSAQMKGLLLLLINNLIQIKENVHRDKKQDAGHIDSKQQRERTKTQEISRKDDEIELKKISSQQRYKNEEISDQLVILKKEMKNELQKFSEILQLKFKLLNEKIQEQSYQTQKKLYEKFTIIFREISNDIVTAKNQKEEIRQNKFQDESNRDAQSLDLNEICQQVHCNQYEEQKMPKRRQMSQSFTQSQYYSKKKENYRFTSIDIASLTNKQLGFKFKKKDISSKNKEIMIKSEADKRQLVIVSDNIKLEGFKKSCKIKIKKVKSWIALGIIDFNMRMKPAKSIGQRWVYYCNDGEIWSGKKSFFNQSSKFNVGEVVEISYDQISKIVEWRVKNHLKYSLKCMKLEYNQNWVPFIYFFSKGDEVVLMPIQK